MTNDEFDHWLAYRRISPTLKTQLNWMVAHLCKTIADFSMAQTKEPTSITDFLLTFDPVKAKELAEQKKAAGQVQTLEEMLSMAQQITAKFGGEV